jgi:hypothetical protein
LLTYIWLITVNQLNNKDIWRDNSLVNGEWVEAQSKSRFDVVGMFALVMPSRDKPLKFRVQILELEKLGLRLLTTDLMM